MADRLWVCHTCELIGSGYEAGEHVNETGHPVEELSQEQSDTVHDAAEWRKRFPTTADWIGFARFKRKVQRVMAGPGEIITDPERARQLGLTADARRMERERGASDA